MTPGLSLSFLSPVLQGSVGCLQTCDWRRKRAALSFGSVSLPLHLCLSVSLCVCVCLYDRERESDGAVE